MPNNFSSFQMQSDADAPSPEELERLRAQVEKPVAPQMQVRTGGSSSISYDANGQPHETAHEPQSVMMQTVHPDRVTINGVETTIKAAIAAGLLDADGKPVAANPNQAPALGADQTRSDEQGDEQDDKDGDPAATASVKEASDTLAALSEALGPTAVEANLTEVVESGALPVSLPEGVTPQHVDTVVAGYTASANHTLGEVGASVPMLEEMLNQQELANARRAVVAGNKGLLQDLGRQARQSLELLPSRDPSACPSG